MEALKYWRTLVHNLAENPTAVQILVSEYPDYLHYTYTCILEAWAVIKPGLQLIQPWLWQYMDKIYSKRTGILHKTKSQIDDK